MKKYSQKPELKIGKGRGRPLAFFFYSQILFFGILISPLYAQTTTINNYYVSPKGNYTHLQLLPRPIISADDTACSSALGTLYANSSTDNALYFCRDDGEGNEWWGLLPLVWTQDHNVLALTDQTSPQDKKIGIGTKTPIFRLTLDNDGGILARGSPALAQHSLLSTTGVGARFIWYSRKAAIRAGAILNAAVGQSWDDANIGLYSSALGANPKASGEASTATCWPTDGALSSTCAAAAKGTTIMGVGGANGVTASGLYATVAAGDEAFAVGEYSFLAPGVSSCAYGDYSVTFGGRLNGGCTVNPVLPNFDHTVSIGGGGANPLKPFAVAVGGGLTAYDDYGIVMGNNQWVNGKFAFVGPGLGWAGDPDPAQRRNTTNADYNIVLGGTYNDIKTNTLFSAIGGGANNAIADNAQYATLGGGENNQISGGNYTALGGGHYNLVNGSHAFVGGGGSNTAPGNQANADYSVVFGGKSNTASGIYSVVGGGEDNIALGPYATVLGGQDNHASGAYSWSGGNNMQIGFNGVDGQNGDRTFAWGYSNSPVKIDQNDAFIIYSGNVGINTLTPNPAAKLDVNGNVRIDNGTLIVNLAAITTDPKDLSSDGSGNIQKIQMDLAETFETIDDVEPGDVLVIANSKVLKLVKSSIPYDQKVIGIVSQSPAALFEGSQIQIAPKPFIFKKGTRPPVALAGRVAVKVSLENGPIEPGDLLTVSSTPGHAMKAVDREKSANAIVGKAFEGFRAGPGGEKTGKIMAIVTLH